MAACLITITGTSGKVLLRYNESAVAKTLNVGIGSLYLDDATVTSITYTTLSGDAIASSGCFTITNLPLTYYKVGWKGMSVIGYKIDGITLGVNDYIIPDTSFPISGSDFINNVNDLGLTELKVVAYKYNYNGITPQEDIDISYILRVIGSDIPKIQIENSDDTYNVYLIGVVSTALPVGYTEVQVCETEILN